MEIDPVCGMEVDERSAQFRSVYKGKTYYFCAAGCKKAFDQNPEMYVEPVKHEHHRHGCCG